MVAKKRIRWARGAWAAISLATLAAGSVSLAMGLVGADDGERPVADEHGKGEIYTGPPIPTPTISARVLAPAGAPISTSAMPASLKAIDGAIRAGDTEALMAAWQVTLTPCSAGEGRGACPPGESENARVVRMEEFGKVWVSTGRRFLEAALANNTAELVLLSQSDTTGWFMAGYRLREPRTYSSLPGEPVMTYVFFILEPNAKAQIVAYAPLSETGPLLWWRQMHEGERLIAVEQRLVEMEAEADAQALPAR